MIRSKKKKETNMLIEKPLGFNDIVTMRLTNGDEVIGKYVESDISTIKLKQPLIIGYQMLPNNQATIGFNPYLISSDEDASVKFNFSAIASKPVRTNDEIAKRYASLTSSIEIPDARTSSLITG